LAKSFIALGPEIRNPDVASVIFESVPQDTSFAKPDIVALLDEQALPFYFEIIEDN
jgi:hypothetical protein